MQVQRGERPSDHQQATEHGQHHATAFTKPPDDHGYEDEAHDDRGTGHRECPF